jgi:hypothetical protein
MDWVAAEDGPVRGRSVRLLYAATAFGALVAVVLAVIGVLLVKREIDKPDHRREAVIAKYQQQYRDCAQRGTSAGVCKRTIARRCAADRYWNSDEAAARYCIFPARSALHT